DPDVMQSVLGPSVDCARYQTEKILHGERGSGPVMSFHFGQRNNQIGAKSGTRQIEPGFIGEAVHRGHVIAVEVDESAIEIRNAAPVTSLFGQKDGIAP